MEPAHPPAAASAPKPKLKYPGAHVIPPSKYEMERLAEAALQNPATLYPEIKWPQTRKPITGMTGIEAFDEYQVFKPKPYDPWEKLQNARDWLDRNLDLLEVELKDLTAKGHRDTPLGQAVISTMNEVAKEKLQLDDYAGTVVPGPVNDEELARIMQAEEDRTFGAVTGVSATVPKPAAAPTSIPVTKQMASQARRVYTSKSKLDVTKPEYDLIEMISAEVHMTFEDTGLGPHIPRDQKWSSVYQPMTQMNYKMLNITPFLDIMLLVGPYIDSMYIYSDKQELLVGFRTVPTYRATPEKSLDELVELTATVAQMYCELCRTDASVKHIELWRKNRIWLTSAPFVSLEHTFGAPRENKRLPRYITATFLEGNATLEPYHVDG